ncbi:alpha-glucosidase/alpha-galactosidase [soil metagenome]
MTQPRITFIGAGSTVFARALLRDLLAFPELHECSISLMDIDETRLADSAAIAKAEVSRAGARTSVTASTNRQRALEGSDYVFNMIQVGGFEPATVTDFEIPGQYGLRQTIGDTLGIGGIMRGLRTLPALVKIARDMEQLCPDALMMNYTNPMATLMWGLNQASAIRSVGLCHSVQGTAEEIAMYLDIPPDEISYTCAGINHMAFYLSLYRNGNDLYPDLRELLPSGNFPVYERVRFGLLRDFGFFVTESSEHFSEYVPWFIKSGRSDLIDHYHIPLDEYPTRCVDQIADWERTRSALLSEAASVYDVEPDRNRLSGSAERKLSRQEGVDQKLAARLRRTLLEKRDRRANGHSGEYGSLIIHSIETGQPRVIHGNVPNCGLITNLPLDCCVEVPCLVDSHGVQPVHVGKIPDQLASLMHTNINVQRMTVEASRTGSLDHVYQAAMLDPHTAAELSPDEIRSLVDDLISAHGDLIPALR